MSAPLVTTLEILQGAILDALRVHFAGRVAEFGAYEPWDYREDEPAQVLNTPALLLEIEEMVNDDLLDSHQTPGRLAIRVSLAIHCLLSIRTPKLQAALPELAASVMGLVAVRETATRTRAKRGNRWGLESAVEYPGRCDAQPGEITPGANGLDSWKVTWEQVIYLSEEALPA